MTAENTACYSHEVRCSQKQRRQSPVLSANTERSSYQKGFKVPKEPTLVPRRCLEIPDRCDLLRRSRVWASSSLVQRKRLEIPDRCNLKSGVKYALSHPQLEAISYAIRKFLAGGSNFWNQGLESHKTKRERNPKQGYYLSETRFWVKWERIAKPRTRKRKLSLTPLLQLRPCVTCVPLSQDWDTPSSNPNSQTSTVLSLTCAAGPDIEKSLRRIQMRD